MLGNLYRVFSDLSQRASEVDKPCVKGGGHGSVLCHVITSTERRVCFKLNYCSVLCSSCLRPSRLSSQEKEIMKEIMDNGPVQGKYVFSVCVCVRVLLLLLMC